VVTHRDLVEAHAFHRRRLSAALVAGAPGGSELEPPRRGRAVVGGVVVAVLLTAGAAMAPRSVHVDWPRVGALDQSAQPVPATVVLAVATACRGVASSRTT